MCKKIVPGQTGCNHPKQTSAPASAKKAPPKAATPEKKAAMTEWNADSNAFKLFGPIGPAYEVSPGIHIRLEFNPETPNRWTPAISTKELNKADDRQAPRRLFEKKTPYTALEALAAATIHRPFEEFVGKFKVVAKTAELDTARVVLIEAPISYKGSNDLANNLIKKKRSTNDSILLFGKDAVEFTGQFELGTNVNRMIIFPAIAKDKALVAAIKRYLPQDGGKLFVVLDSGFMSDEGDLVDLTMNDLKFVGLQSTSSPIKPIFPIGL